MRGPGPTVGDVVLDRVVEQHRVLRDDSDRRTHARLLHRAQVLAVDRDAPRRDVIEAIQEARERRLSRAARSDHGDRASRGNRERDVEQDLPVRLVGEIDVLEADLGRRDPERRSARRVANFGVLLDQVEHPLHVRQRLLDLAVDHAEEVERNVELEHERVDQHQIADGHRVIDHPDRCPPHDERHRDGDDRALADVEQRQRGLAPDGCGFPALHALVVAQRFVFLVIEVLDRLVVEQAVDRACIGPRVELVHGPPESGSPFGDRDRVDDVDDECAQGDADEPDVVAGEQDHRHQRDLHQRGQYREQREADERRDAARAALHVAGEPSGLAREMETQGQSVQVTEHPQRDGAHRALRHLGEQEFAQLGESGRRQAHRPVGDKQGQRQHQCLRSGHGQAIDDFLEHQRHADVGELSGEQTTEREKDPALVGGEVRQQRADGAPVAPVRAIGRGGERSGG